MSRGITTGLALIFVLVLSPVHANATFCAGFLSRPNAIAPLEWLRRTIVDKTLDLLAVRKGLPKYLELAEELRSSGRYLRYENFGEMGLAEIGISVRYNQAALDGLNTGRPLIVVANHHLGIADGLALEHLTSRARPGSPALLFLARWIEKLMPHAVYGDEKGWGTAVPVDINLPKATDPNFEKKMAEVKAFNTARTRSSLRVLRSGGAAIFFPLGHVAGTDASGTYPTNVHDEENGWQDGFLSLAQMAKADIVFANVDSVNGEAFYRDRKRFGGGDKERVIWFFSEALAKKDQIIDVYLSKPMSLGQVHATLAERFGQTHEVLERDPRLTAELMRRYTYELPSTQALDTTDSPQKR